MVLGVVMAGLAAYQLAHVLMLVFASVLVAVLLTALADGVERVARLPRAAAMAVAVLALLAGMVGFGVLFAQQLYRQLADVVDRQLGVAEPRFDGAADATQMAELHRR